MFYNKKTENKLKGNNLEKKYIESLIPRTEITVSKNKKKNEKEKEKEIKAKDKIKKLNKPKEINLNIIGKNTKDASQNTSKEKFYKTKSYSSSNIKIKNSSNKKKKKYIYKLNPHLESVRRNKTNYEKNQELIYNQTYDNENNTNIIIQEKIKIDIIQNPQIKFKTNDEKYRLFKYFKGFGNITKIIFTNVNK